MAQPVIVEEDLPVTAASLGWPAPDATLNEASAWVFTDSATPLTPVRVPLSGWALAEDEVLVRVSSACICGSDLHTVSGKRSDPAAPLILGHEGVGVVVASARAGLRAGVAVTWALAAPQCPAAAPCAPCGEFMLPQKCARVFKYGHAPWPRGDGPHGARAHAEGLSGCFASHALLRARTHVVPLGRRCAGVPRAALASVNCAAATAVACVRAAERHLAASSRGSWAAAVAAAGADPAAPLAAPSAPGPRVLVYGAGLVGFYTAAAAALLLRRAPSLVCVVDVAPARLALAAHFGATHTAVVPAGASAEEAASLIRAACGPDVLFDAAFEVCGHADVCAPALRLLRPGGALVLAGVVHPASALAAITGEAVIRKCASLWGQHNYEGADLDEAVGLVCELHSRGVPWERLFSQPQDLAHLPDALALAATGQWARVVVEDLGGGGDSQAHGAAAGQ